MSPRVAFMTLGVLKKPVGHSEVQGFVDRLASVYAAADGSVGFFARSVRDIKTWEHSWGPVVRPRCAPPDLALDQLAMTLSLWNSLETVAAYPEPIKGPPQDRGSKKSQAERRMFSFSSSGANPGYTLKDPIRPGALPQECQCLERARNIVRHPRAIQMDRFQMRPKYGLASSVNCDTRRKSKRADRRAPCRVRLDRPRLPTNEPLGRHRDRRPGVPTLHG